MKTYKNELSLPNTPEGIGDPFVLRYNGRYYLYPSTPYQENGVHAWVSEDLVDWKDAGWVVRDACLQNTYAPEVWYFNGQFLLVGSPFGQGHYLYASESPLGPFRKVRDNFGLVIDGSIFVDDDAQLYFTHAEYPCIYGHPMTPDGVVGDPTVLRETGMGHWTEGPGIFKRGGKYYITMTGNHLLSRAYRIDYAVSDIGPLGPYRIPSQKTLLVNTDRAHGSLGHSSNVIGPDLDSYWICYHNFEIDASGRHVRRNVNLDRMLFNGDKLSVSGPTRHFTQAPARPDAWGWVDEPDSAAAFEHVDGAVLLRTPAPESFTAEVNLVPGASAEACFGYVDEDNRFGVRIEGGNLLVLIKDGGRETVLASKKLFDGFDENVLHTVRIEARLGRTNVLIDHMLQLQGVETGPVPGRIGARDATRVSYVAFSRHVGQRSDFLHFQAVPGTVDSAMFLPASEGELSGGHPAASCGFRPEDGMRLVPGEDGSEDLLLSEGETVSYRINAAGAGIHHVQAVLESPSGADLLFSFRSGAYEAFVAPSPTLTRVSLGKVALSSGMQSFSVKLSKGGARIRRFDLFPVADALSDEWGGLPLCFAAHQVEGLGSEGFLPRQEGLQMDREVQAMGIFGGRFLTDGLIEADVRFRGDGAEKSAGLFLRLSENSYHPDQVAVGHRGYYVGFDMARVRIDRMNFDARTLASAPCALEVERVYRLRAAIKGNRIQAWVDELEILSVEDPDSLPYGQLAVGSFGARVTVERVRVQSKE